MEGEPVHKEPKTGKMNNKNKMLTKVQDDKFGFVEGLLLVGVSILACLLFFIWFMFLPFEISILLDFGPLSTLGIWLLNLLVGGAVIICLEYRNNLGEFNINGIRYIFTGGH